MIASLPMYWRDETAEAWRGFWEDVRSAWRALGGAGDLPPLTPPDALPDDWTDHWLDPGLILSQTCSLPFRTALRGKVTYVGTFDFELNAPFGHYYSRFVTKGRGTQPKRLAINSFDSQSGYAAGFDPFVGGSSASALAKHTQDILVTGSHALSLRAVAEGQADAAYIDAVTYRLCKAYDPWGKTPYLAGKTAPTLGLPLITAKGRDPAPLRAALRDVCFGSKWMGHPDLGGLNGFVVLKEDAYLRLPVPPPPAQSSAI